MQITVNKTKLSDYFYDFWNINDITRMPIYAITLILCGTLASRNETEAAIANHKVALKLFYSIVVFQTFIKLLFLMRIYEEVSFMVLLLPKLIKDLKPFFIMTLMINVLFATIYMILEVELNN